MAVFHGVDVNMYWVMLPQEVHFSSVSPLHKRTVKNILKLFGCLLGKIQIKRALNKDRLSWGDEEDSEDEGDGADKVEDRMARTGCTAHGVMGTADLRTWRDPDVGSSSSIAGSRT